MQEKFPPNYALFLDSTGELELYDMWRDPEQLGSVAKAGRYRKVRSRLLAELDRLSRCSGADCAAGPGPDPSPLKKRWARSKRKGPARGRPLDRRSKRRRKTRSRN